MRMATPLTTGIDWGTKIGSSPITYYFAAAGEVFPIDPSLGFGVSIASSGWTAYEIQQFGRAFAVFETFLAVTFVAVASQDDEPDLLLIRSDGATMGSYLGFFNPPGEPDAGLGAFNADGLGWAWDAPGTGALEQGGYGFVTIIHELGHGLGLAHPHDDGGTSSVFPGVKAPFDGGQHQLNQGVYTMMSYNSGWPKGRTGEPATGANYSFEGTPMAIDIAVLQEKYGANLAHHVGDDTYVLPATNARGTFYLCIWDAGGTDSIVHHGSAAATIDLRAATLAVEPGGGGFVSYVQGVHGGFTIANGVVIENATGGSGNDTLTGNAAANVLERTRRCRHHARPGRERHLLRRQPGRRRGRIGGRQRRCRHGLRHDQLRPRRRRPCQGQRREPHAPRHEGARRDRQQARQHAGR
jgi:serralysin